LERAQYKSVEVTDLVNSSIELATAVLTFLAALPAFVLLIKKIHFHPGGTA